MEPGSRAPTTATEATQDRWVPAALDCLTAGGVVAIPTETFYGLAVDPRDPAAVATLRRLKGHGPSRSLLLLAADAEQVRELCAWEGTPAAAVLAGAFWPGALTLILPLRDPGGVPACPAGTAAVRVPAHPVPRILAAALGHPVTGTSANRAGEAPARRAAGAQALFGAGPGLVLDGGETPGGAASTLVDLAGGAPTLLRPGPIGAADVEARLGLRLSRPGAS